MTLSHNQQELKDAVRQRQLRYPASRQEAAYLFILSSVQAAHDLFKVAGYRREGGESPELEETADYMLKQIADNFREYFGKPLFDD